MRLFKTWRQLVRIDSQLAEAERLLAVVMKPDSGHRYHQATLDRRGQEALRKISEARAEIRRVG